MYRPPSNRSIDCFLGKTKKGAWRPKQAPIRPFRSLSPVNPPFSACLLYRRIRKGKDTADRRCAGRKWRSRDQGLITLSFSRTAGCARTRKSIPVGVGSRETICECFQKFNNLVLLLVRQAEITSRHVDVVRHFGLGPAVDFFDRSCRAMSGSDVERKFLYVTCVVEVDELLQALDVAVVKELLLKVRSRRLGGGTPWRRHSHIACRRYLHLAVGSGCLSSPSVVRAGPGTEAASQECS